MEKGHIYLCPSASRLQRDFPSSPIVGPVQKSCCLVSEEILLYLILKNSRDPLGGSDGVCL